MFKWIIQMIVLALCAMSCLTSPQNNYDTMGAAIKAAIDKLPGIGQTQGGSPGSWMQYLKHPEAVPKP